MTRSNLIFSFALIVSCLVKVPTARPQEATAPEEKIETVADAEKVVIKTVEEAKKSTAEVVDALKSGDLATAAKRSGALFARYGIPAIVVIVLLIISYFVAAFVARISSAPLRSRVDETLGRFVGKLVFYLIMVSAILGVLQYFGVGITSFAAVIAAAGFAIGLAFQGTLSNFSAGIMLMVFRPFKVGDFISAAGITAKVNEIDLFTTTFDTPDNRRLIIPNSAITGGSIENITFHDQRRCDVAVGVDYAADLGETRKTLEAAVESLKEFMVTGEGRGCQIMLDALGDSAVTWQIRFWTKSSDYWDVKEKLTAAIKNSLDRAGISIPFPQMDIHVRQEVKDQPGSA